MPVKVDVPQQENKNETYAEHDQNKEKEDYYTQKIYDKDLGDMYLIYE